MAKTLVRLSHDVMPPSIMPTFAISGFDACQYFKRALENARKKPIAAILPSYLEVTAHSMIDPCHELERTSFAHADTVGESYALGVADVTTSPGNVVRAYDKEKTICDLIRHKGKAEFETYAKALNLYARSTDKDINKLMEYARVLKIEKEVRISSYDGYGPFFVGDFAEYRRTSRLFFFSSPSIF